MKLDRNELVMQRIHSFKLDGGKTTSETSGWCKGKQHRRSCKSRIVEQNELETNGLEHHRSNKNGEAESI